LNQHNNISEQDWEQLEDYIHGKMLPPAAAAFKTRLDAEPTLQQARLMIIGMKEAMLTEQLDAFHKSANQKTPSIAPQKRFNIRWMAAAAILIAIAASAVYLFGSNNNQKLAAAYFEPDPGLPTTMGQQENYELSRGMVDYKMQKYTRAIETWRPLIGKDPTNDTLHYFSGIAFFALGKTDSAANHLHLVSDNIKSAFVSEARWHLALCLLSKGEKAEARLLLQQTNHPKKEELLSQIK